VDEVFPEKVLGFRADMGLINSLLTLMFSIVAFFLQQLIFDEVV